MKIALLLNKQKLLLFIQERVDLQLREGNTNNESLFFVADPQLV